MKNENSNERRDIFYLALFSFITFLSVDSLFANIFIKIGDILIAIGFCSLYIMSFPKFKENPVLEDICIYSYIIGASIFFIGFFYGITEREIARIFPDLGC